MCDPCVNVVLQNVVEELYTGLWDSIALILRIAVHTGHKDRWCRRFCVMRTITMQERRHMPVHTERRIFLQLHIPIRRRILSAPKPLPQ